MSGGRGGTMNSAKKGGRRRITQDGGVRPRKGPMHSVLKEMASSLDCLNVSLYVLKGTSLRRTVSVRANSSLLPPYIPLSSNSVVAAAAREQLDHHGAPDGGTTREGDLHTLPIVSSGRTLGVIVLTGPRMERNAVVALSPFLKGTTSELMLTEAGLQDAVPDGETNFGPLTSILPEAHLPLRLDELTRALERENNLRSIQLYWVSGRGLELAFSAGPEMLRDGPDAMLESARTGRTIIKIRHDSESGLLLSRTVLPIMHGKKSRMVAAYEIESSRADAGRVRSSVSSALGIALRMKENEHAVSLNWLKAIRTMDGAASESSRTKDASSSRVLAGTLVGLQEAGFIEGYRLLRAEELERPSHTDRNADAVSGQEASVSLMAASIRGMRVVFDVSSGKSIAFPVQDAEGGLWAVLLRLGDRPLLGSERNLWEDLGNCFGILIKAFIARSKSRRQTEESRRLKSGASAFLETAKKIESVDTVGSLVARCTEGISRMTRMETYGLLRDGAVLRQISPDSEDITVSVDEIMAVVASSSEIARSAYTVPLGVLGDRLSRMIGSERNDNLYIITIRGGGGELNGAILCAGQKGYFPAETRDITLAGIALLANIKMAALAWSRDATLERKKLRKVEEVVSRITLSESEENVVSSIVAAACELTASEMATLSVLDVEKNMVISESVRSPDGGGTVQGVNPAAGVMRRIMRTQDGEIVNDYASDPDRDEYSIGTLNIRQLACVPVRIDVKHRGALLAANPRGGPYRTDQLRTLELLSNIASYSIRATNARSERSRLKSDFESLQAAELKLYSATTFGGLVGQLAGEVKSLFHASSVLIAAYVNNVKRIIYSTSGNIKVGDIIYNSGPIGLQFEEPPYSARIVERAAQEEEWARGLETNELLLVRAGTQQDSIVIAAANGTDAPKFETLDIDNFGKISRIASTARDKTTVLMGMNQKLKHLEIMHTIVDALVYGKGEYDVFNSVLPTLVNMCSADVGLLWKLDEEKEKITISAEYYVNTETEHLVGYETNSRRGIVGSVVVNRMPVLIANAAIDNKAVQISGTNIQSFESVLGVPLIVREKLLGVLMLYRDSPPPFTTVELDVLSSVSNDISLMMAKHRLEADVAIRTEVADS